MLRGAHYLIVSRQHSGLTWVKLVLAGSFCLYPKNHICEWQKIIYSVSRYKNLRLSPLVFVPQRDRRPCTICDYLFFFVNLDTTPFTPAESMQCGRTLLHILQQVMDADPRLGPVHMFNIDIVDGCYHIWINGEGIPKLGGMFPLAPG
jgi:hypothetical protein